jgi:uncharacterized protein YdgA (DUF945 family)
VKRWLVAVLVLLALIIIVSPGIVGRLAEKSLDENIDWVASENPEVSISTERFERGWFTSEGRHRVVFSGGAFHDVAVLYSDSAGSPDLPTLVIDTRIDHGLVPVSSMSRESGSLMPALANTISTFQFDPGTGELIAVPGKLYSNIGVSGTSESRFLLAAGSFGEDALAATWQGADLLVTTNPANGNISVEGSVRPFSITEHGGRIDVGAMTVDLSQKKSDFGLNVGNVDFELESLSGESDNGPFSMGTLAFAANASIDDARLEGATTFSVADIVVPGMGNVALTVDVSVHGLHAESLGRVTAAMRRAQRSGDPESALQSIYPQIEADLQTLISSGAEIRVDQFDVRLPQGNLYTNFQVDFAAMDEDATFSWASVLLKMTASMDLRLPVEVYELVKMTNPEAESLVAMGFLKRQGDDYVMAAEYAQGLLNVNGAPMPIPMPAM